MFALITYLSAASPGSHPDMYSELSSFCSTFTFLKPRASKSA